MVALGHDSGLRPYWDIVPSPILYIWFSENSWQNELILHKQMPRTYVLLD